MKCAWYFSQLLVPLVLGELPYFHWICAVPNPLRPSLYLCTPFALSLMTGYHITSSRQTSYFLQSPFGCPQRCCGVLIMGSLPSSCIVSPHHDWTTLEIQFEPEIKWTQICTWRPLSCDVRDTLGDCDQSCLKEVLGGNDGVCCEMYFQAMTEWVWQWTCSPWSFRIGVLGGCPSRFDSSRGRSDGSWDTIHWKNYRNGGNFESWVQYGHLRDERGEMRDRVGARDS